MHAVPHNSTVAILVAIIVFLMLCLIHAASHVPALVALCFLVAGSSVSLGL